MPIEGDYIWRSAYVSSPASGYYMNFECIYPKEPVTEQFNYIKNYIRDFETNLKSADFKDPETGFRKYIDEDSFVDNFIIQEFTLHLDIFARSQFFYKDRGKKLVASPLWDANSGLSEDYTNAWRFSCGYCDPRFFWMERLMEDCDFKGKVIDKYKAFRKTFLTYEKGVHYIDSVAAVIQDAVLRDRDKWHQSVEGTFSDDVQKLKNFVILRLNWLDSNIHSITDTGSELMSSANNADMAQLITLTSNCPTDSPVLWTFNTDDGETGTFIGNATENISVTKTASYYAKCQTTCPVYSNSVRVSLNNPCPDNLALETSSPNPLIQEFRSKYNLVATAPVGTNSKTSYSAGGAIVLSAGFSVTPQEVFEARISGCD